MYLLLLLQDHEQDAHVKYIIHIYISIYLYICARI